MATGDKRPTTTETLAQLRDLLGLMTADAASAPAVQPATASTVDRARVTVSRRADTTPQTAPTVPAVIRLEFLARPVYSDGTEGSCDQLRITANVRKNGATTTNNRFDGRIPVSEIGVLGEYLVTLAARWGVKPSGRSHIYVVSDATPETIACRACGKSLPADMRLCGYCGAVQSADAPVSADATGVDAAGVDATDIGV